MTTTITHTSDSLQAQGWRPRSLPGFVGLVGPLWTQQLASGWAYGVLAGPEHLNPAGVVHGGLLMSLMDHTLGAIAWEAIGRRACVTVQMDTQFLSGAREGQFLIAQGRVTRTTSSLVFMNGMVSVEDKQILAASALFKVLERSP
ncbi:PaaI family thioesterase [Variovorax sp. GT1P44]|uniref:PaaI family thioesterase n=1 Tax=Variovorax sp. GT1P44 TaxID=3443742 RepID=UPI003F46F73C